MITKENLVKYNPNGPQVLSHPCMILILGGSGSVKTNPLLFVIEQQNNINSNVMDKMS